MNKLLKLIKENNIIYYFFIDSFNVFLKCKIKDEVYYVIVQRLKIYENSVFCGYKENIECISCVKESKEYFEKLEKNISKYEDVQNVRNYVLEMREGGTK